MNSQLEYKLNLWLTGFVAVLLSSALGWAGGWLIVPLVHILKRTTQ